MTVPDVANVRAHLEQFPVHKGPHTYSFDGHQMTLEKARTAFPINGYRTDQILGTPGLVDLFNEPRLLDLIEAYMGCVPTLFSVNGWWSFPADKPEMYNSQYFHRDTDDWRFIVLFIYLTDVDSQAGPHQVLPGSHSLDGMKALVGRSWLRPFDAKRTFVNFMGPEVAEETERMFADKIVDITGPAGSMFLVNTLALHRGLMPTQKPRLLLWGRYGFGPTAFSSDRERGPLALPLVPTKLPDTPRNRYVNRFLFDFDRKPWY